MSVELDGVNNILKTDTISEVTSANGVTIDGVALKDGAVTATGVVTGTGFTAGSAVLAEAELELLDGLTAGTAIASKVVTTDGNIDTTGMRNLTISGELDAATGDFSGAVDIAGATTVAALTASGVGQIATLGVGAAKDLGVALHVKSGDSGASVDGGGDELVVESSGAGGISILTGNSSTGKLAFGDDGAASKFSVNYDHSTDLMKINTASAIAIQMDQTGAVTKPLQPAFFTSGDGSTTPDIANNGNPYASGMTERFDKNADLSSAGVFTAPVTGTYTFSMASYYTSVDDTDKIHHFFSASNRNMYFQDKQMLQ